MRHFALFDCCSMNESKKSYENQKLVIEIWFCSRFSYFLTIPIFQNVPEALIAYQKMSIHIRPKRGNRKNSTKFIQSTQALFEGVIFSFNISLVGVTD